MCVRVFAEPPSILDSQMDVLPVVLAQLVMQFLSIAELLPFARCSRSLLYAADSLVAVRFALLRCRLLDSAPAIALVRGVQRHASLSLYCGELFPDVRIDAWSALFPRIRQIVLPHGVGALAMACKRLLTLRALKPSVLSLVHSSHIRSFNPSWDEDNPDAAPCVGAAEIAALRLFPALHTLCLDPLERKESTWRMLGDFPALTRLSLVNAGEFPRGVLCLSGCSRLQALELKRPAFSGRFFRDFASQANLQANLRELRIDVLFLDRASIEAVFAEGFAMLRALRIIHLALVRELDAFLPVLRFAPALREAIVIPSEMPVEIAVLQAACQLLEAAPLLRMTLRATLPRSSALVDPKEAQRVEWSEKLRRFGPRFDERKLLQPVNSFQPCCADVNAAGLLIDRRE